MGTEYLIHLATAYVDYTMNGKRKNRLSILLKSANDYCNRIYDENGDLIPPNLNHLEDDKLHLQIWLLQI